MRRGTAPLVLLLLLTTGCLLGGQPSSPSEATIDPDDPPFQVVVDGTSRYDDEVVWRDRDMTRRLSGPTLNITDPGNYTLRVFENGETVDDHDFVVHRYELAGCNRDVLRVRGATIGGKLRTQVKCTDPSDAVDRPDRAAGATTL